MATPNPLAPVKGAGTTLWMYTGAGDPYANPMSDTDWIRLAKVKELTPGEMTAESYNDSYIDDDDADWSSSAQGEKSAGDTSVTLGWMPGEVGQQSVVDWFTQGDIRGYKIKYKNGAVDVFRGWVSGLGKAIQAKEMITRTVKVTNSGKPSLAEDSRPAVVLVSSVTASPATGTVTVGKTATVTFNILPANASDKTLRIASSNPAFGTVTAQDNVATLKGVAVGVVDIVAMTADGRLVATARHTVTAI